MTVRLFSGVIVFLIASAGTALNVAPARAQSYEDGMSAYESGDFERAARIWDPLAASGDATAQYSLGKLYETGSVDLPRDYGRAVEWYRLAAGQGVAAAQNNLGLMYAQGRGVARDSTRAAELWSSAAKQNHPMAQFNLGLAYFRGEGVAENKSEAEAWFRRAAELGLADAQYALGQIKLHGLTADADRGQALAWYQLAAAQGHAKAKEQAELLRKDGVKPRMEAELEQANSPAAEPRASQAQVAATPAPAPQPVAPRAAAPQTPAAPVQAQPQVQAAAPAAPARAPAASPQQRQAVTPQVADARTQGSPARIEPLTEEEAKLSPSGAAQMPAKSAKAPTSTPEVQRKAQVARAGTGAVPSDRGGKVRVWLYSARDEGEAIGYLRRIETKHAGLLTGIDGSVMPVQFDERKVYYRVVAGGFPSWDAAIAWCKTLKTDAPGTFCKVLPTRGGGS